VKLTRQRLEKLKAQRLPHLEVRDLDVVVKQGADVEIASAQIAKLAEYLHHFAGPSNRKCICCGETLTGTNPIESLMATFQWDITHGEGFCGKCHYPSRGVHTLEGIGKLNNIIFQYHPSGLIIGEPYKVGQEVEALEPLSTRPGNTGKIVSIESEEKMPVYRVDWGHIGSDGEYAKHSEICLLSDGSNKLSSALCFESDCGETEAI